MKYDDVMNDQRKVVYTQRCELMDTNDAKDYIDLIRTELVEEIVNRFIPENTYSDQWEIDSLHTECVRLFNLDLPLKEWRSEEGIAHVEIRERILEHLNRKMEGKERHYGSELMRMAEKSILLRFVDQSWKENLLELDHLRQGINLRAYAQRDPLNEYKQEAFVLFNAMLTKVNEQTIGALSHLEIQEQSPREILEATFEDMNISDKHLKLQGPDLKNNVVKKDTVKSVPKKSSVKTLTKESAKKTVSKSSSKAQTSQKASHDQPIMVVPGNRNALCSCGSGKRFKHCHGKID